MKINLNDRIKVKLTDLGKVIYFHRTEEMNFLGKEPYFPKTDEDGYTEFLLWDFISLYGEHIGICNKNVIEPLDIIVIEKDSLVHAGLLAKKLCKSCVKIHECQTKFYRTPEDHCTEYEPKQTEEIKVGDEVTLINPTAKCVVIKIKEEHIYYMTNDGNTYAIEKRFVHKTGKHFPQIAEILKELGGE